MADMTECHWKRDEFYDYYDTECENAFELETDGPKENGMNYCPYCGKKLVVDDMKGER